MLSERAAAEVLAARQGIGREQARQLLLSGAAGAGRRVGRSTAYDDDLVHDLAQRPPAALGLLAEWCPQGVQAAALAVQPPMAPMTRALVVHVPIVTRGGLPWVATVSGFVVLAAVATGAQLTEDGRIRFDLEPAGGWREAVEGRWWHTGPGRHWFSWHPDRLTQ